MPVGVAGMSVMHPPVSLKELYADEAHTAYLINQPLCKLRHTMLLAFVITAWSRMQVQRSCHKHDDLTVFVDIGFPVHCIAQRTR